MKRHLVKVLAIAYICIICAFSFISCKTDDEFAFIYSITFTSAGETKRLDSTVHRVDIYEKIEKSEYMNAPSTQYYLSPDRLPPQHKSGLIKLKELPKNGTTYEVKKNNWNETEYQYWSYGTSYYKSTGEEVTYEYIYLKVIDNETIIIKASNGETTYKVTSYRARYFEE